MKHHLTKRMTEFCLVLGCLFSPFALSMTLHTDAYGDVKIGMTESDALSHLEHYISTKEFYDYPEFCYYLLKEHSDRGVYIMLVDHKVARFDIADAELNIQTQKHVGIGSLKEDILTAYPNVVASPHPYLDTEGEYLEVKLENGNGIIFETKFDVVTSFRLGTYPAIELVEGCL